MEAREEMETLPWPFMKWNRSLRKTALHMRTFCWEPGEGDIDAEGKQVMRVLARNMVFLMKSIALGKEQIGLPETENRVWTNFHHA